MKIVCGVQARMGSTRLPGKVLLSLSDKRVIEWVLERCRNVEGVDEVFLAIGDEPENLALEELCNRQGIEYLVGSEVDLLKRHLKVVERETPDLYVRITGDCPFVPSEEIDRLIEKHKQNGADYTTNNTDDMPIGTAADVFNPEILKELKDLGEDHPVKRLRKNPDEWNTEMSGNPKWEKMFNAHTAVDTPKDYWNLIDAIKNVGTEPEKVTRYLHENG